MTSNQEPNEKIEDTFKYVLLQYSKTNSFGPGETWHRDVTVPFSYNDPVSNLNGHPSSATRTLPEAQEQQDDVSSILKELLRRFCLYGMSFEDFLDLR
jgi:hypothetical protein